MIKVGVVGLGKMGLSHHALMHAHPEVEVVACDSSKYVLGVLEKNTGVGPTATTRRCSARPASTRWSSPRRRAPTRRWSRRRSSAGCTCSARSRSDARSGATSRRAGRRSPRSAGLVTQVGYHNRFVGAFGEVKRLLDAGAIGEVTPRARPRPTARSCSSRRAAPGAAAAARAAAASTTTPPTRSTCSTGTSASRPASAARCCGQVFSARDRRRGLQHALLRRRRHRASSRSTGPTSPTAR